MTRADTTLETLWRLASFQPNPQQREAILHTDGPLFLPAGPGSGKTRVLLWRALNLIVCHDVPPEAIYLSTFTEKAARQLREGLRSLLGAASNETNKPYDIAQLYVGTVHSLCHRLVLDRRLHPNRQRGRVPVLADELGQYFYIYHTRTWERLTSGAGLDRGANKHINGVFNSGSISRHKAVVHCMALFNRLSEECLEPDHLLNTTDDGDLLPLLEMYRLYREGLRQASPPRTDFSLMQQDALQVLADHPESGHVFQHVIVDEYQDTNTVQERLFFRLASGHKNLCVVGDDDQALYRFRGATVENLVEFPDRCQQALGMRPTTISLGTNYRSRPPIVDFCQRFICCCNWERRSGGSYRVAEKEIQAARTDRSLSVVASQRDRPEVACAEIADLVVRLLREKRVDDPNQIAFLYPSLRSKMVQYMQEALQERGLRVYAPRAGRFLEVDESIDVFGLFVQALGEPERRRYGGQDYKDFNMWLDHISRRGKELRKQDRQLDRFVRDRQREIETALSDYHILTGVAERKGWPLSAPYHLHRMKRSLYDAPGLSDAARRSLGSASMEKAILRRQAQGRPFKLQYIINSATALDWNVLDLFYRLCGFKHFREMFDLAESGEDEGPICNLALISQCLARLIDEYVALITPRVLEDDGLTSRLFNTFLFALFRLGESEYENPEDPFPRGRIPFLTIHQSKGLEFPVVVLGNPSKRMRGPQRVEQLVHPFLERAGEPLERMDEFDAMRLFYVALSRAKNLLVIAHFRGRGISVNEPFKTLLDDDFPRIPALDVQSLPPAPAEADDTPHSYSYTSDYLFYQKCPRQYMIFRKYEFVPARSQTQMFGSLVHRTLDDLHQFLIAQRSAV